MTPARDEARAAATAALVAAVVEGRPWDRRVASDPDWDGSLRVLELVLGLRWTEAARCAGRLPGVPPDDDAGHWLRRAVTLWAEAGDPGPAAPLAAGLDGGPVADTEPGRFAAHLLVEAVLAHARLDLASALVDRYAEALVEPHPFGVLAVVCRARVLAFRGDIAAADRVLAALGDVPHPRLSAVVSGTVALVRGNDAAPAEVRRAVAEVDREVSEPGDHLACGAHLLAAFGEIALGEVAAAARRVLVAGGDEGLSRLNVADRALGLEVLVALAVAEEDLDAAEAWADRLAPLLVSPIADATAARALSRVALLAGRYDEAVAWGERAVARARAVDRVVELAEGEIVLGRARLAGPGRSTATAARALGEMVAAAERRGHRQARRAAARELRAAGVRLAPLAGSGWSGLSEREAEVARLVAGGASNRAVATALHISDHTVRAHVSRVLAAFGVATRATLPAAVPGPPVAAPRADLTPRQREVVALLAGGLRNDEIADRLGLSHRTVERHVSDVLLRWSAPNRTALASLWHAEG